MDWLAGVARVARVARVRAWFVVAPGERPLSRIVLILTVPIVYTMLRDGLTSLVLGTAPKGGRYASAGVVAYGLVMAWPTLQIVRGRATPAHLVVAMLMAAPGNRFTTWQADRPLSWAGTLIPVVVAAVVSVDLAWRLHRRTHPKSVTYRLLVPSPPAPAGPPPDSESLEALQAQLRTASTTRVSLWVPEHLTYAGAPIPDQPTGLAAALLLDTALDVGLQPDGTSPGLHGTTFHYRRPHVPASEPPGGHRA
jgi:hypothetical protein